MKIVKLKIVVQILGQDQGCKRDGIFRDGRDRDSKIIFLRDGTDFRDSGTGKNRDKTGSPNFLLLKSFLLPVPFTSLVRTAIQIFWSAI